MSKTFTPEEVTAHRREWLAALRSGEYKQTTGYLAVVAAGTPTRPVGYCCLGVACDLSGEVYEFQGQGPVRRAYDNGNSGLLPPSVSNWLGLDGENNIQVAFDGRRVEVSELNDSHKLTFAQIADLVEAEWFPEVAA